MAASSSNTIVFYKNRTTTVTVRLGYSVVGDTLTCQVRTEPNHVSQLIATIPVVVVDASVGHLTLTMDDSVSGPIVHDMGYLDIKRVTGGEPVPVFATPLEVEFQGTVTA